MKTLHLTLKKQWFDMIASGEKKRTIYRNHQLVYSRLCSNAYLV